MLARAVEVARALSRTLAAEVERARAQREVLRTLDAAAVFATAARRAVFNGEVARLGEELSGALHAAAASAGGELSMELLTARFPAEAAELRRVVADLRAHATTLARLDQVNRTLTARALAFINGYLGVLRPTPTAYDRRGVRFAHAGAAGFSSKV